MRRPQGPRGGDDRLIGAVRALAAWLLMANAAAGPAAQARPSDAERRGQAIYQSGQRLGGPAIPARREGLGPVPAAAAACAACHRRSGMGEREAGVLAPALAGERLFVAQGRQGPQRLHPGMAREALRAHARPAYTPALLGRALRAGLDPAGRALHTAMPRYAIGDTDLDDLIAYLRSLGRRPPPGLGDGQIHLASVFTPDADPLAVRTLERTLAAWAANAGLGTLRLRWRAWHLQGPASSWHAQLRRHWREQPVLALVSGAGGTQWAAVDAFCESHELVCLMPTLERLPQPQRPGRHHAVYFSGGVEAEAGLLAEAWHSGQLPRAPVINCVLTSDPAAPAVAEQAGAQALGRRLAAAGAEVRACRGAPADVAAQVARHAAPPPGGPVGPPDPPPILVLWARPDALAALARLGGLGTLPRFLSEQLAPPHRLALPAGWQPHVRWLSMRADPTHRAAGASLATVAWARGLGLDDGLDPVALGEAHAATFFFSDALARMREGFSLDYLLERLEAAVDRRPAGAVYYRLALGPGQRVAARHGRILGYSGEPAALRPLTPLLHAGDP